MEIYLNYGEENFLVEYTNKLTRLIKKDGSFLVSREKYDNFTLDDLMWLEEHINDDKIVDAFANQKAIDDFPFLKFFSNHIFFLDYLEFCFL